MIYGKWVKPNRTNISLGQTEKYVLNKFIKY